MIDPKHLESIGFAEKSARRSLGKGARKVAEQIRKASNEMAERSRERQEQERDIEAELERAVIEEAVSEHKRFSDRQVTTGLDRAVDALLKARQT